MASLADHIDRILGEKGECLTAVEITLRVNVEFVDRPYTIAEIVACADEMPNVYRSGKEYCRQAR